MYALGTYVSPTPLATSWSRRHGAGALNVPSATVPLRSDVSSPTLPAASSSERSVRTAARELWSRIWPVCRFLEGQSYPAAVKAGCAIVGDRPARRARRCSR